MLPQHTHATKPRYIYTQSPDYTPLQKILLFLAAIVAILLIGFAAKFLSDFFKTYQAWLNHAAFYFLKMSLVAIAILLASATAYAVCWVIIRIDLKRAEHNQTIAEIATITANNSLFENTTAQIAAGHVYLSEQRTEQGVIKFKHLPKHAKEPHPTITETALSLPEPNTAAEPKTTLLNDILPLQRLLIVGGQNSGKTTLLKHIAQQRRVAGSVLVLDSHNHLGKWASDYRIVGHGRDYSAIETELKNLVAVMDSRYKEYSAGKIREREHELITVISDEWTTISENIQSLDSYLLPLLTESRKVGIDFVISCHSETAASLGLKGRFDLKKNFDAILRLKNYSGKRLIHFDNGESVIEYANCGEFNASYSPVINQNYSNKINSILNNPIAELSIEQKIISAYWHLKNNEKPITLNAVCLSVYGYKKGDKLKLIARVLAENSLVTSN